MSLVDVEIRGARPVGSQLQGEPDPLAADRVVAAWSAAHPDHHILMARYVPHEWEMSILIGAVYQPLVTP